MSKKTKDVAVVSKEVVPSKRKMAWGGIIPKSNEKEGDFQKLSLFCNQVAEIYGVPSMGVNAMGGNPYLNKDGRLFLLSEIKTGKEGIKAIRKEFIEISHNLAEPAIVKVTLVFKDGLEVEAIGEASAKSVKLEAVKQTLNMMAETRAMNRAIWQAISHGVWERVSKNLAKANLSPKEQENIIKAGSVSYEEMQQPTASENFAPSTEDELIADLKSKVDAVDDIDTLIDYSAKLNKGKSSKKVKAEVDAYIRAKVDKIGGVV